MTSRENVSSSWKEGRFLDLWVVPHAMTGVTGAFSNVFFELSTPLVFIVGLLLMVVWEIIEMAMGIREAWENQLLDVVIGLAGVAVALIVASRLGERARIVAFAVSLTIMVTTGVVGWLASRRKRREGRAKGGSR
jgi:uncharacterized membrane protein